MAQLIDAVQALQRETRNLWGSMVKQR